MWCSRCPSGYRACTFSRLNDRYNNIPRGQLLDPLFAQQLPNNIKLTWGHPKETVMSYLRVTYIIKLLVFFKSCLSIVIPEWLIWMIKLTIIHPPLWEKFYRKDWNYTKTLFYKIIQQLKIKTFITTSPA